LGKAHRQEIRTLDDKKRKQFEVNSFKYYDCTKTAALKNALNWMKVSGLYNRIARVHKYSGVHSGPAFTLWHREYLKRFELIIRHYLPDPNMGVPYWDSTLDAELPEPSDSIMFSNIFLGETNDDGFVVTGPYANWTTMEGRASIYREVGSSDGGELLNNARVDWIVNNPNINMVLGITMPLTTCPIELTLDARMLEYSHDYVHFYIGGDMGKSHSSSNDVVFLYHHSMIDLIYELWRQKMQVICPIVTYFKCAA
ncbi:common central domain of tyrosinase, partial [Cooperia oncophora]